MLWLVALSALAAPPRSDLRLEGARPLAYGVELWLDPDAATFRGTLDLDVELEGHRSRLWLNAVDLDLAGATVTAGDVTRPAEVVPHSEQVVGVSWQGALTGPVRVHLEWTGRVQEEDSFAVFRQVEGEAAYLFTQFEATEARRALPCIDEPGFKTPWDVVLHVPAAVRAYANAPALSDVVEGDARTVTFARTEPLPTYLVAFAVGPFEEVDAGRVGREDTPVRIIVPRGRAADAAWAVQTTGPVVEELERWFDRGHPYPKLDIVAVPSTVGYGAMEHPGLVTVAQGVVLAREDEDTVERRRTYVDYMAHELAHQWFGNLVTMAWWDDLWLSESFASWMEAKIIGRLYPEWQPGVGRLEARAAAMAADTLPSVRRIREPIRDQGDIEAAFDEITYQKGEAVLAMIEGWMGPEAFQRGVRRYLAEHAHGNATAADLVAALERETEAPVGAVLHSFVDQPGAPLVSAEAVCGDTPVLELSQGRFLVSSGPRRGRWNVPVCVRTAGPGGSEERCTLLDRRRDVLPIPDCPLWVVPNVGSAGYYRSALDEDGTRALFTEADLSLEERIGALGDASALVARGDLSPAVVLDQIPPLVALDQDAVTRETLQIVGALDDHLVPDDLRPAFARFVRATFGEKAHALGFAPSPGERGSTTLLRPRLLRVVGHLGGDEAILDEAVTLADGWLETREGVERDVLPVVLGLAVRQGDPARVARLREAALAEEDRELRIVLLGALAEVREPEALRAVLDLTVSDEVDLREGQALLFGPLSRADQQEVALAWLETHLPDLETRVPAPFRFYLAYTGAGYCDAASRARVEALLDAPSHRWIGGRRALASTLEDIDACIASTARQAPGVRAFLDAWR